MLKYSAITNRSSIIYKLINFIDSSMEGFLETQTLVYM